jgi:Fe-S-cluster containining protein
MSSWNNSFRPCGDCTACCDGHLVGNSHGNPFGRGRPCVFLVEKKCAIYKDRPNSCHKFQCAWTQNLLPEWMRPDNCGLLVSVEINKEQQNQFLKVIEMREDIDQSTYTEIDNFCNQNNTYYVRVGYHENRGHA